MMEYNHYYPVQPGQPPPPPPNMMNSQTDYLQMGGQMMIPNGPQMMQPSPAPSTPHSMQQTPSPMPMQQHMGSGPQMHPQQQPSPHMNYHQRLQQSPLSHSASPHSSTASHTQQPPPRPSTGPSPLHHQSPIHMNGPSPKLHPVTQYGPPSQPQAPGVGGPIHMHAQGGCGYNRHPPHMSQSHHFINNPLPPHSSSNYGQSSMNTHQPVLSHPSSSQMHSQGSSPQVGQQLPHHQANISNRSPPSSSSLNSRPTQSGYMVSPLPPAPMHHNNYHHHNQHNHHNQLQDGTPSPSPIERGSPFYQHIPQTEFRLIKLNKRLQNRPRIHGPPRTLPIDGQDEMGWWRRFASDFFDDEAILSLSIPSEDGYNEYNIGRTLIPRFFKSYFDGGVTDFSIKLRNVRETSNRPGFITLDCDQTDITTKNFFRHQSTNSPLMVVVHTEGHLSVEFVRNHLNNLLIRSWNFYANQCNEYVDRSVITTGMSNVYLVEPITRFGLTKNTFAFLKMCMIMEPMQDLMLQHRQTNMDPKSCLKQLLYDRFKLKSVDENQPQPAKRRRRKAVANDSKVTGPNKRSKTAINNVDAIVKSNQLGDTMQTFETTNGSVREAPSLPLASQDILVVGEPMLGADFVDENERRATRLENNQYDPSAIMERLSDSSEHASSQQENCGNGILQAENDRLRDQIDPISKQQQQLVADNNECSDQKVPDPQHRAKVENQNDHQESSSDKDVVSMVNYNTCLDQGKLSNQSNDEEKHGLTDSSAVAANNSRDISPASTNNKINSNNDQRTVSNDATYEDLPKLTPNCNSDGGPIPSREPQLQSKGNAKETTEENINEESPTVESIKSISNVNTKKGIVPSNRQNRRRSSERRETLREGLMRTSDFVIAMKDLKLEHPSLWRITTGNNLLQQFEPKSQNGVILFENTNQYAGWNPEIRKDYVGVDVRLTQHTRNQITVERLLLNFQKMEDAEAFHDRHFAVYLQILISTALDSKFWESIESEPRHHDYFITSRRIVDDIVKRYKLKLSGKLKLEENSLKDFEKYPNLVVKKIDVDESSNETIKCRACNSNSSTQEVSFENSSYDLYTFKPVKVTSEPTKPSDQVTKDQHQYNLCDVCLDIVKLFSDLHHMSWKFFNIAREKVEQHKAKGKPINVILDECLKDEDWMTKVFAERDAIWSKVEETQ